GRAKAMVITGQNRSFQATIPRLVKGPSSRPGSPAKCLWFKGKPSLEGYMPVRHIFAAVGLISCLQASFVGETVVAAEPKRVLLLHPSSGANLLGAIKVRAELERQSPEPLEFYDAALVTGRPLDDIVADRYGDYLRSIFPDKRLDLAVVVG